jgi:hypothetical protein
LKAFLDYAVKHKINVVGYSLNSTNWLQGLDVVCFGLFKQHLNKLKEQIYHEEGHSMACLDFLGRLKGPLDCAFHPENILEVF